MKSPIEIKWVEPPTSYASKFDDIIEALLANPGKWLMLPEPSKNSNTGLRQLVRRHDLPVKITTRARPDGMFDIYAVCTSATATTPPLEVLDMEGSDA
jgi:hypothetical protein